MDVMVEVIIEELRKISKSLELEVNLLFNVRSDFWMLCDILDNKYAVTLLFIASNGKCLHHGSPVRPGSVMCPGRTLEAFALFDPADPEFFPKIKQRLTEDKTSSRAGRLVS